MDNTGYRRSTGDRRELANMARPMPRRGEAVKLTSELEGITTQNGILLSPDKLGPGLVEQVALDGTVCVHWLSADILGCLPPEDLLPLGKGGHIVKIMRYNAQGNSTLVGYKISVGLGFEHNWTVELRPRNVVRVLRDDGWKWTFERNPIYNTIKPSWPQPRDDGDAEALTAADIAITRTSPTLAISSR